MSQKKSTKMAMQSKQTDEEIAAYAEVVDASFDLFEALLLSKRPLTDEELSFVESMQAWFIILAESAETTRAARPDRKALDG